MNKGKKIVNISSDVRNKYYEMSYLLGVNLKEEMHEVTFISKCLDRIDILIGLLDKQYTPERVGKLIHGKKYTEEKF